MRSTAYHADDLHELLDALGDGVDIAPVALLTMTQRVPTSEYTVAELMRAIRAVERDAP